MPSSGPKSISSRSAGLRAPGSGSAVRMVPTRMSTCRNSATVMRGGSVSLIAPSLLRPDAGGVAVVGRGIPAAALAPAQPGRHPCRPGGGNFARGGGETIEVAQGAFAPAQATIECGHGAGEPGVIIGEPGVKHRGVDAGEPGQLERTAG